MRKAVQVDDEQFFKVQEKLAQLEVRTELVAEDKLNFGDLYTFSGFSVFMSRIYNKFVRDGVRKCRTCLFIFKFLMFILFFCIYICK